MAKYIVIILISFLCNPAVFAQAVTASHDIQSGSEPNEYTIKTTINGLIGVDIARIKYLINNDHTYKASPNNSLFSDRNENYIKFYIMAIPESGIINVEFGLIVSGDGEFKFPVEFQYSRNEEKQTLNLPDVVISGSPSIASVEPVEPTTPTIEEEPVAEVTEPTLAETEENPVVEETPTASPIVEEEPIAEVTEPVSPVVEEEPIEEVPEPVPSVEEENPVIEETPSTPPVVEEEPIEETPAPPIIEEAPAPPVNNEVGTKYTVQLLSLMEFSQTRLNFYCKQHNLSLSKIKKNKKGEWMKITYGEANSKEEAYRIIEKLKRDNKIKDAFVVPIK